MDSLLAQGSVLNLLFISLYISIILSIFMVISTIYSPVALKSRLERNLKLQRDLILSPELHTPTTHRTSVSGWTVETRNSTSLNHNCLPPKTCFFSCFPTGHPGIWSPFSLIPAILPKVFLSNFTAITPPGSHLDCNTYLLTGITTLSTSPLQSIL